MAEAWSWSTAARKGPPPQELARARAEVLTAAAAPVAELWRGMTTRETLAFRGALEADVARLRGSDEAQAPIVRESAARTGAPMAALNRALNRAARRVEQVLAPVPVVEGPGVLSLLRPVTIDLTSFERGPEPVVEPATEASPNRPMCERHSFDRSADDCSSAVGAAPASLRSAVWPPRCSTDRSSSTTTSDGIEGTKRPWSGPVTKTSACPSSRSAIRCSSDCSRRCPTTSDAAACTWSRSTGRSPAQATP